MIERIFARWPLLIAGLILVAAGVRLADPVDTSDARALLLGVGCVVVGAGLVLVVQHTPPRDPPDPGGPDDRPC